MKKLIALALALLCLFSLAGLALAQENIPAAPTGPERFVQDYANLLTQEDRNAIINKSQQIQKASGAEIVVITVNDLGNEELIDYATEVFAKWKPGDKEKQNGLLIIINKASLVKNQRNRMGIHPGPGLEGALPDNKLGQIMDQFMQPRFDAKDYSGGITAGYNAVADVVAKEYNIKINSSGPQQDYSQRENSSPVKSSKLKGLIVAIFLIVLLIIDNTFLGGFFTGMLLGILMSGGFRGGGFGGGGDDDDNGGFGGGGFGGGGADR